MIVEYFAPQILHYRKNCIVILLFRSYILFPRRTETHTSWSVVTVRQDKKQILKSQISSKSDLQFPTAIWIGQRLASKNNYVLKHSFQDKHAEKLGMLIVFRVLAFFNIASRFFALRQVRIQVILITG